MRWSVPEDETSKDGLGAGISWALDPSFGPLMQARFKENDYKLGFDFVTEELLNDAIQRALFQWANNHKYLTFFNVTDKCNAEGKGKDCSVAELYIRAATGAEQYGWMPVQVLNSYSREKFSGNGSASGTGVKTTAGTVVDGAAIQRSEIVFFIDHPVEYPDFPRGLQCFYLDTTFCEPFQRAQKRYNAKLLIEVITFVLWAAAFCMALKRVVDYAVVYATKGREGLMVVARTHASHILYSYYILLMLILPPAFYWVAVHPCFLCQSFESLAVGAVGRALGFQYTNSANTTNYVSTAAMGSKVCEDDLPPRKEGPVDPDSVMLYPDPYDANYCLTESDLDGLYHLYPLCTGAKVTPGCMRSKTNVGYLRVGLAFGVPFGLASLVVFISVAYLRRAERKAADNIKKRLGVNAFTSSRKMFGGGKARAKPSESGGLARPAGSRSAQRTGGESESRGQDRDTVVGRV